ncbi:hypothetical protein BLOT_011203 [Blomia tropicalis]|nr:hypothetical protein BLOT_011203 [Blomia tropicalis]
MAEFFVIFDYQFNMPLAINHRQSLSPIKFASLTSLSRHLANYEMLFLHHLRRSSSESAKRGPQSVVVIPRELAPCEMTQSQSNTKVGMTLTGLTQMFRLQNRDILPFGYGGGGGGGGGGGEAYLFMRENKIVNKQLPQREKMTL